MAAVVDVMMDPGDSGGVLDHFGSAISLYGSTEISSIRVCCGLLRLTLPRAETKLLSPKTVHFGRGDKSV